jgi:quercetin dioxygenase-like cupin family protein
VLNRVDFEELASTGRPLAPEECAALARSAATLVDPAVLRRHGEGSFLLLWRNEHSEGWLNTWWKARDTGFHDHGGSSVGVYVLEGRARAEALVVGGGRRVTEYGPGEAFSAPATGIHRMDHEPGAVTIHVYSPPLDAIGHYDLVDGELHRHVGPPDEGSPPSPSLIAVLEGPS